MDSEIKELIDLNLAKTNKYNTLRYIFGKKTHEHLFENFIYTDEDIKSKIEKIKEMISEERIKSNSLKYKKFCIWNRVNIVKSYLKPISDESGKEKYIHYYNYKSKIHDKVITDNSYVIVEEQIETTFNPISYSTKDKIGYIEYNMLELICGGEYSGLVILLSNLDGKNSIELEINRPMDLDKLCEFISYISS